MGRRPPLSSAGQVHIHGVAFLVALLGADDRAALLAMVRRMHGLAAQRFACGRCGGAVRAVRWHCHQCERDFCRGCYLLLALQVWPNASASAWHAAALATASEPVQGAMKAEGPPFLLLLLRLFAKKNVRWNFFFRF